MTKYRFDALKQSVLFEHKINRNHTSLLHRHNGYEIYLFLRGNVNFYFEHFSFNLKRGNIVIIRPKDFHRAICIDDSLYERINVNIKRSYLEKLSTEKTDLCKCFDNIKDQNDCISLINEKEITEFILMCHKMQDVSKSEEFGSDIISQFYVSQLLIMTNNIFSKKSNLQKTQNIMPKLISDIVDYIEAHITEDITLKNLSDSLYLNGTYISRKFKEYMGITLQKYITAKKITLAESLLKEGHSVTDVCYMAGYKNYSNFIRTFTNNVGVSPGKYKKNTYKADKMA